MRAQDEIVRQIELLKAADLLGFEVGELLAHLDFEHARPYLTAGATAEEWSKVWTEGDYAARFASAKTLDERARAQIVDYLPFAVDKAAGHRGISAERSVGHLRAWFWLLGDDEMVAFIDDDGHYQNYGAPILKRAAERLGAPWPDGDELPVNRMARGLPCSPGCDGGCGP